MRWIAGFALCGLLAACGSPDEGELGGASDATGPGPITGRDAGAAIGEADAGAPLDASSQGAPDAEVASGEDAGSEGPRDAAWWERHDAGPVPPDASLWDREDAGAPTPPDAATPPPEYTLPRVDCVDRSQLPTRPEDMLSISSSCSSVSGCGGSIEGEWQYDDACRETADLFTGISSVCGSATLSYSFGSHFSGTATFAQGVWTNTGYLTASAGFDFPNWCHGCRCDDLETRLLQRGVDAQCNPVCNGGTCTCFVDAMRTMSWSSPYTIAGARLTTDSGIAIDFCRTGDRVAFADVSSGSVTARYELIPKVTGIPPELCDGSDNDGNGAVDEYPLDCPTVSCSNLGVCAQGVGAVCSSGGWRCLYLSQDREVSETRCDGLDNDCDGQVDEPSYCGPEICDEYDNDGDGLINVNLTDTPPACSTVGVCGLGSEARCEPPYAGASIRWWCRYSSTAWAPEELSEAQLCDGLDNDCDGTTDEPSWHATRAPLLSLQKGVCLGIRKTCGPSGWFDDFASIPKYELVEASCDGLDNDCDGSVDEDLVPPIADKHVGVCAGMVKICAGTQGWREPNYGGTGKYYDEDAVDCDGLDNDCDGRTDEGRDADADGFYVATSSCVTQWGGQDRLDCDDAQPLMHQKCIVYVNGAATGAANGATWTDAFVTLQDALAFSKKGYEIWVAQGVYTPDRGGGATAGDPGARFLVDEALSIYGGFAGGETQRDARDPAARPTILSGDLLGDDGAAFTARADNSRRVLHVQVPASYPATVALLDGLIIEGGYDATGQGAGAYLESGASLQKVTFRSNAAAEGGAVYSGAADSYGAVLQDCTFSGNQAARGAAVAIGGAAQISGGVFLDNVALEQGGGVYAVAATGGSLSASRFIANRASGQGGALYGALSCDNCVFDGNHAATGGGAVASTGGHFGHCTFANNVATSGGSALHQVTPRSAGMSSCASYGNSSPELFGEFEWRQSGLTYSIISGSCLDTTTGVNNVNLRSSPFVDLDGADNVAGNADDDLHLAAGSGCPYGAGATY